ncbi:MAG: threonylcarbamoyl-AMP synthase [Chloroflexi bacterium]|nr:threonylcarbamoyl-AMP synthase [Chloroflexota bacterium]
MAAAAAVIRGGGVVAFPTDTFYGLGVDPFNERAVESLFAVKGRAALSAVPILIAAPGDMSIVAATAPDGATALAEVFWPGALTLVLEAVAGLPGVVSAGAGTVGVRVPDHPAPRAIARAVNGPITGTSANRSGEPPMKAAGEVKATFGDALGFVLDGVCGAHDAPSTVVDFTVDPPLVRRHGAITLEALLRICPDVVG